MEDACGREQARHAFLPEPEPGPSREEEEEASAVAEAPAAVVDDDGTCGRGSATGDDGAADEAPKVLNEDDDDEPKPILAAKSV